MRKLPTRKLLGALIAGAFFLPGQAFTLGLGEIEVNSALNQALKADIEVLSATPEDAETIIVKLASRKEFQRAGLDRPYSLNDLRFKSKVIDGSPYITVSSTGPIREPFLNFLVEVDWPNGHILREYTVLLDPPVFMTQSASAASSPANQRSATADDDGFRPGSGGSANIIPVVAPGAAISSRASAGQSQMPADSMDRAATSSFVPAPVIQQQATINQPAGAYRIKAGDTAWSLADAMRPDQNISVEQMMVAMLRANPESFINENVNGLKRGYILRVPDYDQIASVNQADARALVREQAALWKQYQQAQSGGQPVSAMEAGDDVATSGGAGSDSEAADDAYLEIVSAGTGTSTISGKDPTKMSAKELRAELALARERVETERVEKEALQSRVESLEQHVDKMKGMLSIEDNELSDVQSLNMPADGDLQAESTAEQVEQDLQDALAEEATGTTEAEGMELDTAAEAVDGDVAESGMVEADESAGGVLPEAESEDAVFTDETAATSEQTTSEMPEQADTATSNVDDSEPPLTAAQPEDPLNKLLNDPVMQAVAGGGLLLILGLIGLVIKRRKDAAAGTASPALAGGFDDIESIADEVNNADNDVVAVDSLAGDNVTTDEAFDSDATMILDSADDTVITEASSSAAYEEDEEPRDDVIAEADVYLAYGIYQQAEDLLTQAIAENPERDDYRLKLAETHYASKNTEAFEEVAREIKKRATSDDSPTWKKVMVMGQDMCADNPMFQGSMVGGLDVGSLVPGAPSMDFDLGLEAVDDSEETPDLDLTLDDEPLELPEMEEAADDATVMMDAADIEEEINTKPVAELEFDLSDTGAIAAEETAEEDEFSLDIDVSELDIEDEEAATADAVEAEESINLDDIDIGLDLDAEESASEETLDVSDIDLDFGLDDVEEPAAVEATEEDAAALTAEEEALLSDDEEISLDLTDEALDMDFGELSDTEEATPVPESAPAPEVLADVDLEDDGDFDLSSLDDVDEISTKLDLARAYLDMGDHEGSRGILEEVLADGDEEQKREAAELIEKLD